MRRALQGVGQLVRAARGAHAELQPASQLSDAVSSCPGADACSAGWEERDRACGHASSSGRPSPTDLWAMVGHSWASVRAMTSLTRNGIPAPRMDVAAQLSTMRGGHLVRLIQQAENLPGLERVLVKHEDQLKSVHIAVAALKMERLLIADRSQAAGQKAAAMATRMEARAHRLALRLTPTEVGSIVRSLTSCSHRLGDATLTELAAALLSNECERLRYASAADFKNIVYGFAHQGYSNPRFWQRLCAAMQPHMGAWDPNALASILCNLSHAEQRPAAGPLLRPAVARLTEGAGQLGAPQLADVLRALPALGLSPAQGQPPRGGDSGSGSSEVGPAEVAALVDALAARGMQCVPDMGAKPLALFVTSLAHMGRAPPGLAEAAARRVAELPVGALGPLYAARMAGYMRRALGFADAATLEVLASHALAHMHYASPFALKEVHQSFSLAAAAAGSKAAAQGGEGPGAGAEAGAVQRLLSEVERRQTGAGAAAAAGGGSGSRAPSASAGAGAGQRTQAKA